MVIGHWELKFDLKRENIGFNTGNSFVILLLVTFCQLCVSCLSELDFIKTGMLNCELFVLCFRGDYCLIHTDMFLWFDDDISRISYERHL